MQVSSSAATSGNKTAWFIMIWHEGSFVKPSYAPETKATSTISSPQATKLRRIMDLYLEIVSSRRARLHSDRALPPPRIAACRKLIVFAFSSKERILRSYNESPADRAGKAKIIFYVALTSVKSSKRNDGDTVFKFLQISAKIFVPLPLEDCQ